MRRFLSLAVVALALASACKKDVGREDAGADKTVRELPPLTIRDDTPNLLLTWIDLRGGTHVANVPPEVPSEGRTFVRILVNGSDDGATDPIYVADLTHPEGDGAFVARSTPRRDWEAEIAKRRDDRIAAGGDTPDPSPRRQRPQRPPSDPNRGPHDPDLDPRDPGKQGKGADLSHVDVTVYGASWCGPCHSAMDYLKKRGTKFVFKDVDKDPSARDELERKVARLGTGNNTRSIPIIDVGGRLLFGFSTRSLDDALAQAGGGTIL